MKLILLRRIILWQLDGVINFSLAIGWKSQYFHISLSTELTKLPECPQNKVVTLLKVKDRGQEENGKEKERKRQEKKRRYRRKKKRERR